MNDRIIYKRKQKKSKRLTEKEGKADMQIKKESEFDKRRIKTRMKKLSKRRNDYDFKWIP